MKATRIIVTRPARDAARWVAQFRKAGVAAEAFPLIDIAPCVDAGLLQQTWSRIDAYAALMFVSANAVEAFFSLPAHPGASPRFMAPGPGTVAALRAAGVRSASIDAPPSDATQFDSESLWAVVGARDWRGKRVLVVRGNTRRDGPGEADAPGRDWLARHLVEAGAQVDFIVVYERRSPVLDEPARAEAATASRDGSVWLFSSSEAVGNLASAFGVDGGAAPDWSQATAICTHPRIAGAARAAGWGRVFESRPDLEDIKATFASIESAAR
ncbi:MAG: uroporphyrinogen-III synthase [Comamonadaceae bacterium]|nr:MAG: uroporphyrinogen-III synthase [Comamonadaceae bacterium]